MAQVNCRNCGREINQTDAYCPGCGAPVSFEQPASPEPPLVVSGMEIGKLIRCDDCGREISSRAPVCPHCGAPRLAAAYQALAKPDWGFEWKSATSVYGWPLVQVAFGRKNGRLRVAKGIIAIGQFAIGLFTFAQFGIGIIFGFGQFMLGATAIAQFAISAFFAVGQFATGYVAIGQIVFGYYALAQVALAWYGWTPKRHDPEAVAFFTNLLHYLRLK